MTKLMTALAFLVFVGCKSSPEDRILDEYTKMKDNLCACAAKDCADRAKAQADAIEQRARQDIKSPSKEVEQKFEKVEDQINECARKFP
jgi:hypothetical protein